MWARLSIKRWPLLVHCSFVWSLLKVCAVQVSRVAQLCYAFGSQKRVTFSGFITAVPVDFFEVRVEKKQ